MEYYLILENKGKTYNRIKKFRKILLRILLGIFLFFFLFFVILSLPPVQTYIAKKVTKNINESFGTHINIDKIHITFYGGIRIKGIYIEDYQKDTLIYVKRLNTNLYSFKKAIDNNLDFGNVGLDNATLNIKTYKGETNSNLDIFIAKLEDNDTMPTSSHFIMKFKKIDLRGGKFRYIDENFEDPVILNFSKLSSEVHNFKLIGPEVYSDIQKLVFVTETGLAVKNLKGVFRYSKTRMQLENFDIVTRNSAVKGNIYFDYDRKDFSDFLNKVKVSGDIKESTISAQDVNMFYNEFGADKTITLTTDLSGTLNNLKASKLNLHYENSEIKGDYTFINLFESDKPYTIKGNIENISSDYYQLTGLLPNVLGKTLPTNFARFGSFSITGEATISENYILSKTNLRTDLGSAISDLTITNLQNIDNASYKGHIILNNFNIGKFTQTEDLGKVTLEVDVDGKGFTQDNVDTHINGRIKQILYNKYTYRDIVVRGDLKKKLYNGYLKSYDRNLQFTFEGLADLTSEKYNFKFETTVDHANLKALHFVERDSISNLKGQISINIYGNTIDDLTGEIKFLKTEYTNQNNSYYFEDFAVTSEFEDNGIRNILIDSPDIISGHISGKFRFDQILKMVENSVGSIYPNYQPYKINTDQFVRFNFKIYDKIVDAVYPDIKFGPNTIIRGSISTEDNMFKLSFKSPSIDLFGYVLDDVNLQVDNKNPLYNTYVEINSVKTGYYDIKNFNLINSTINDTLFFRTEFSGGKNYSDAFKLNFYHTFNKEHLSVVGLKTSELSIKGNKWFLNKEDNSQNKILFDKRFDSLIVDHIVMSNDKQRINLNGKVIDSTYKNLNLKFDNVNLQDVTPDIDSLSMSGVVNGNFKLLQNKKSYFPTSNLTIDNFTVNSHLLGDFEMDISGNESLTNYNVNVEILNSKRKILNINGNLDLEDPENMLDLNMYLRNLDLAPFSPLGGIVLSDLRGVVTGDGRVTGSINNPKINGLLNLYGAGLKIPYLGLDLDFSEGSKVVLTGESFSFDNVTLIDTKYKTSASLDGSIMHHRFEDWSLNLGLITNNERFLVLNTLDDGETLFYGTAFLRGSADIYGSVDALNIDVAGTTERGTSFKIPINDAVSIGDDSFIRFINKHETKEESKQRMQKEYSGLELSFDLTLTPKAEIEIVTDRKTGSTLKGRGEGTLYMEINTNGKFNMWGDFITTEGTYNFKNYGLINKTFSVLPGGSITWEGDPTQAVLRDLKAVYSLNANPSLLLENNQFNRKIKTNVIINLEGELMNPTTSFDIEFPDTNPVMASELNYRLQDADRRQRQAIYLLSSGTFVGDDNNTALQGVANNLVAESLFSQINNQLGGSDNKLKVGLSYEIGQKANPGYDYRTDDQFGVTISTQINDRIIFNGKVGVPVGGVTETVVAGDAEVQILLNEDGTLSAKVFNKQTEIQDFMASTQGYTQGVGLSYQVDFDTFGELWRIIFKGKREEEDYLDNDPEKEQKAREDAEKNKKQEKTETQGDGLVKIKSKNDSTTPSDKEDSGD